MAANLQLLKRRIKTSKSISQIAKAMEMIAASKIKKSQSSVLNNKPYAEKITAFTNELLSSSKGRKISHEYLKAHSNSTYKLIIFVSPDRGLCGSLFTNLTKEFLNINSKNNFYITIGKKAEDLVARFSENLIASFQMGSIFPSYSIIYPIIKIVNEYFLAGKVCEVNILYTKFNSIFNVMPNMEMLLPIHPGVIKTEKESESLRYIFEPNPNELINNLLPHYLEIQLYKAITEAYTSEQAARMIAMQNAKNNALDIVDLITLEYNKSRQERITSEILDLSNGQISTT